MFTYKKAGFNTLNDMFNSMLDKQSHGDHKSFVKMSSLLTFNDKLAFIDYSKGHKVFAGAMKDMLSECCGKFSVSQNYANLIMNALTLAGYYTEVKDSLDCNYPQFNFSDNMLIEGTVHLFEHKVCLKAVDATGKLYEKSITFYTDKDLVESVNHFQKDIQETFNKKEDVSIDALLQNPEFMASIGAEDCLVKKQADTKDAVTALSEYLKINPKDISTRDGINFDVANNPNKFQVSDTKKDNMPEYKEHEQRIDNNNRKFIYEKSETPKIKEEVKIEDKAYQVINFYKKASRSVLNKSAAGLSEEEKHTLSNDVTDSLSAKQVLKQYAKQTPEELKKKDDSDLEREILAFIGYNKSIIPSIYLKEIKDRPSVFNWFAQLDFQAKDIYGNIYYLDLDQVLTDEMLNKIKQSPKLALDILKGNRDKYNGLNDFSKLPEYLQEPLKSNVNTYVECIKEFPQFLDDSGAELIIEEAPDTAIEIGLSRQTTLSKNKSFKKLKEFAESQNRTNKEPTSKELGLEDVSGYPENTSFSTNELSPEQQQAINQELNRPEDEEELKEKVYASQVICFYKKASVEELKTAIDNYDLSSISNQGDIINELIDNKPCISYTLDKYASDEEKGLKLIKKLIEAGAVILSEDVTKAKDKGYSQTVIAELEELLPSDYEQEFARGYNAIP